MAGYSPTPLWKKLGYKSGMNVHAIDAPDHYQEILSDLPDDINWCELSTSNMDLVHVFCTDEQSLENNLPTLKNHLKPAGMLWISWPKMTAPFATKINREKVRELGLAAGLVDVKVCAVDENWSGLKFVYRVKDRK